MRRMHGRTGFAKGRAVSLAIIGLLAASSHWLRADDDEVAFLKQHVFRIPIEVAADRDVTIRELRLFVSSDRGSKWQQLAVVPPSQRSFTFRARVDGEYWFNLAYVDETGRVEPADIRTQTPGLKVTVDTQPPVLQMRPAERTDGKAGVEWRILDDYPVELSSLRMEYRDKREGSWKELYPEAMIEGIVDWPASADQGFVVRATVEDKAGNVGSSEVDVPGNMSSMSAMPPSPTAPPANDDFAVPPAPNLASTASVDTRAIPRAEPPMPTLPTPTPAAAPMPSPEAVVSSHSVAKPTYMPQASIPNGPIPAAAPSTAPTEMIASTAMEPKPAPHVVRKHEPPAPTPRIPLVGNTRFAVDYTVRGLGPAGVGKVELYYTKDNGVLWSLLGEDPDRTPPFEVELPGEGRYGMAIIVTSPAGNGQRPPQPGDAPSVLVEVDTTAPEAELYRPVPDPASPSDSLLISWSARDAHMGERPVRLYYAVSAEGPWEPISADLPSTGQYSWRVPPRTPYQVFLRLAVSDLCNNESAATTPEPVMVDLSQPEAEVIGIAILPEVAPRR